MNAFKLLRQLRTPNSSHARLLYGLPGSFQAREGLGLDDRITVEPNAAPSLASFVRRFSERALRRPRMLVDDVLEELSERLVVHHGSEDAAPAEALKNEESMRELLKLVDTVSPPMTEYPQAASRRLEFFLQASKSSSGGDVKKAVLDLKTTGGLCKTLVERQLEGFFKECGVESEFQWQENSWLITEAVPIKTRLISPEPPKAQEEPSVEPPPPSGAEPQAESERAPASNPTEGQEGGGGSAAPPLIPISEVIEKFDRALDAIASLPWHTEAEDQRRIQRQLVCVLEGDGWRIQEACLHLWAGERDIRKVCAGMDEYTRAVVERIHHHLLRYEEQHGKRTAELAAVRLFRSGKKM